MATHFKIANKPEDILFNHNHLALVEVDDKKICLAKFEDKITAFVNKCPHANGNLNEGYIDAKGNIVCPVHFYKFNMQNGKMQSHDDCRLKIYTVEERNDGVYLAL